MFDVIVCGSLHLDIVVKSPALPRIDETLVGTGWNQMCGGKGGNQAVQAAAAGAKTAMIARIGADGFGATLRENLHKAGVNHQAVEVDATAATGMSVAILKDDGDYGAVIVSGANLGLDAETAVDRWTMLGGAKTLVLQNEVPETANVAAAAVARASGATIILNAAPYRDMSPLLLDAVDVLVVNRIEAEALCGNAVATLAQARAAASRLVTRTHAVIVTLGGQGLVLAEPSGAITEIEAMPVDVTSTHGAGDCFVGALAAALARGASRADACRSANLRAAAFVSR